MNCNCKVGDIARIVSMHPALADLWGHFVTCEELYFRNGEAFWRIDRALAFKVRGNVRNLYDGKVYRDGEALRAKSIPDANLRPIRGDERDDETPAEIIRGLTVQEVA